jgi:hypothetical protein
MKEHNFNLSIDVGAEGEKIIQVLLESLPTVKTVVYVGSDESFQKRDIDFVVTTNDGDELFYELKTEPKAAYTGNLFFETVSNESYGTPGCFVYSEAHYWLSYVPQTGDLYVFPLEKCREWFLSVKDSYPLKKINNGVYYSAGYAIPISTIRASVPHSHRNVRDFVDYVYIESNPRRGISSSFQNVVWKI